MLKPLYIWYKKQQYTSISFFLAFGLFLLHILFLYMSYITQCIFVIFVLDSPLFSFNLYSCILSLVLIIIYGMSRFLFSITFLGSREFIQYFFKVKIY